MRTFDLILAKKKIFIIIIIFKQTLNVINGKPECHRAGH